METEAVTKAFQWLHESMPFVKHAVTVTDSQNVLKRLDKRALRKEWLDSIENSMLRKIPWIYAPIHTGLTGNEQVDKFTIDASVNTAIKMDKQGIMKALACRPGERASQRSIFKTGESWNVNRWSGKTNTPTTTSRCTKNKWKTETIIRQTLHWILDRGTEHVCQCPGCLDAVLDDKYTSQRFLREGQYRARREQAQGWTLGEHHDVVCRPWLEKTAFADEDEKRTNSMRSHLFQSDSKSEKWHVVVEGGTEIQ